MSGRTYYPCQACSDRYDATPGSNAATFDWCERCSKNLDGLDIFVISTPKTEARMEEIDRLSRLPYLKQIGQRIVRRSLSDAGLEMYLRDAIAAGRAAHLEGTNLVQFTEDGWREATK